MDDSSKDARNKGKLEKPNSAQESSPEDLPPVPAAPTRLPTPVLLRQLQSAIDRLKRGEKK